MRAFRPLRPALFLLALSLAAPAQAASLRVAPASIELPADASVATLTLRNDGEAPAHYQIRVFRWVQENGAERLEPTKAVAVSPPITKIAPGVDYTVRVVRLAGRPVTREESYRVLVDELPEPGKGDNRTVSFLVRYSIPVFFSPPDPSRARLDWRLGRSDGGVRLTAKNSGRRRVKITNLRLRDASGRTVTLADGLAGYVLAGAERGWTFGRDRFRDLAPGPARLLFQTEREAVDVPVELPGRS